MLRVNWRDKHLVHVVTTLHSNSVVDMGKRDCRTGTSIKKPACVVYYTQKMMLVDMADILISNVQCVRKYPK